MQTVLLQTSYAHVHAYNFSSQLSLSLYFQSLEYVRLSRSELDRKEQAVNSLR